MGISRSATVVCAYLVATTSMNATEAIDFVREKRDVACPNIGFRHQLEKYSNQLIEDGSKAESAAPSFIEKLKAKKTDEEPEKHAERGKAPAKKLSVGHWFTKLGSSKRVEHR